MGVSFANLNQSVIDVFGVDATYTPDGGSPQTLRMVFDYIYYQTEGGIGIQARKATAGINETDAPAIKAGEAIAYQARNFTIAQVQPDGHGYTELDLIEVI